MPEICRFYGIVIRVFWDDHPPPHFHVEYSGHGAVFDMNSLAILDGRLPPRAMGLVAEWATIHQRELLEVWKRARNLEPLGKIDPLP